MPNKGNSTRGSNAVTGIGTASVTHKETISTAKAITLFDSGFNANGFTR
jgi:hypothetical protein